MTLQPRKGRSLVGVEYAPKGTTDQPFEAGLNLSTTRPGPGVGVGTGGAGAGGGGGGVGVGREDCEPILKVSFKPPALPMLGREGCISVRMCGRGGCHFDTTFDLTF
jgi:hypothetical protein